MKKICIFCLMVLLCVSVCFPAFADMGGPEMIGYSAEVKSDTPYYDWEWDEKTDTSYFKQSGVLPAGTVIRISNEYLENGEWYGYFYNDTDYSGGYVRIRDLKADVEDTYPKSKGYKQRAAVRLRVTDPNGVTIFAGPSFVYDKLSVIPTGAEVTVDTLDQESYEIGSWMYVSYGGVNGWVHCFLYTDETCPFAELLPKGQTGTVWVVKDDAELLDRDGNTLITIPKGEKLTFTSFNRSPHCLQYHVTYQGKTGAFTVDDDGGNNKIASNLNNYCPVQNLSVKQDYTADVYAYPEETKSIGTIRYPSGSTLHSEFLFYGEPLKDFRGGQEWINVNKDGQEGWIKVDWEKVEYPENEQSAAGLIPNLRDLRTADEDEMTPETTLETTSEADPAVVIETESASNTVETASSETTELSADAVSGRHMSPVGILGVCIAAAVVLSLTALVTLRLIRRKKQTD